MISMISSKFLAMRITLLHIFIRISYSYNLQYINFFLSSSVLVNSISWNLKKITDKKYFHSSSLWHFSCPQQPANVHVNVLSLNVKETGIFKNCQFVRKKVKTALPPTRFSILCQNTWHYLLVSTPTAAAMVERINVLALLVVPGANIMKMANNC